MFKNLLLVVIWIIFLAIFNLGVIAQSPTPMIEEIGVGETQEFTDPALKISFRVGDQEYPSKRFALVFEITSIIESGKIGVDWIYPKGFFTIEGPERDRIDSIIPGEKVTLTKYFIPKTTLPSTAGVNRKVEFGARVLALIPELNYLSSTKTEATFNEEWEIIPQGEKYQNEKLTTIVLNIIFWIVVIIVAGILLVVGIRKFIKYLNTDDVER